MATILNSESRRLYSWWWDSHNSPKNSKWLLENLTDMDAKVKAMIKLIEEDADSFARRAEMYYKKRPELMKLVEEFYRAYRALAERYNHATGELRQAHRTMAQAFPDQLPFVLGDDTPSSSELETPESPHPIRTFFDPDNFQGLPASSSQGSKRTGASIEESDAGSSRKGLKQVNDMLRSGGVVALVSRSADGKTKGGQNLNEGKVRGRNLEGDLSELSKQNEKLKSQVLIESERADKAAIELETLSEALTKLEAEKDAMFLQYKQSLDKLSTLEKKLNDVQKDSGGFDELACEAKTDVEAMKEALKKLEAERDDSLLQYRQSLERLVASEGLVSETREEAKRLCERAINAKIEPPNLKQEVARLEAEKEAAELLYKQCLENLSVFEKKHALAEESLRLLNEQSEKAKSEVKNLKKEISKLNEERDVIALRYEQCLQTISALQHQLSEAQADNGRLNSEILLGSSKLRGAEEQCVSLGKMNESLQLEAQNLSQKIAAADQELSVKQSELEILMISLQDEHLRFVQVEATLHALQNLHLQSQEEQRALASELRDGLQMMKDLDTCKRDLEEEIQRLKDENQTLSDLNSSSSISRKSLQDDMLKLKEINEKLEAEVRSQAEHSDALQFQVQNLKEEIEGLYRRYKVLLQQVESVGLNPESFVSSVKELQDENLRLKEISVEDKANRQILIEKLLDMEELLRKNNVLESSLYEVNVELQNSKEKAKALQDSCRDLNQEKSIVVTEKAALLSQLQIITETMQNLLEKNTSLQTSLCGATMELEGLRAKSKGLEEFCQVLSSERSNLLVERSSLVSRLEVVEKKLDKLEMRLTSLEDKYTGLEMEKQSTLSQVEELRVSLDVEKKERTCLVLTSEARLSGLEGRILDLQDENKHRKKEFEEQLEKAVNAQVESLVLQKFIQDMEDKNYSLLVECQRHVEAAKCSEKLMAELESENMVQQVEAEILLDKIEMLREGITQVLEVLEIKHGNETEPELIFLPYVLANNKKMKISLSDSKDESQELLIEKSVLSTILGQVHLECAQLSSKKEAVEQESLMLAEELVMMEDEKDHLVERSRQLKVEVAEREKREEELKAEVGNLHLKQAHLQGSYSALEEETRSAFEHNRIIQEELQHVMEEKNMLVEESSAILGDALGFSYLSVILRNYGVEKALELNRISEDMNCLSKAYRNLENEAKRLEEKLLTKEVENTALRAMMEKLEEKQLELSAYNGQLRHQISDERDLLIQKETELLEAEQKHKAALEMETELCSTIQCLRMEHENLNDTKLVLEKQVFELSGHTKYQEKEIASLREANGSLESDVGKLHEELEECKIREVILASELHERSSEFEIWEAEAASFYFDLQISSVLEALFENKFHELGSLCEGLEDISNRRSVEIERMKARVSSLETEAEALKSQLATCLPLVASLKYDIALLEQNPVLQPKLHATSSSEQEEISDGMEESLLSPDALFELQKLQTRIKVIEDIVEKEKETVAMQEQANVNIRLEAALKEIYTLKTRINITDNHDKNQHSAQESEYATSEVKFGAEMKDIPLDQASGRSFQGISHRGSAVSDEQMLGLWEAAEQDCGLDLLVSELQEEGTDPIEDDIIYAHDQPSFDPIPEAQFEKELGVDKLEISRNNIQSSQRGNRTNALETLASDAQKLMRLQISVQELKRKIEPNRRRKKHEDAEYDAFRGQLQDIENSLVRLMDMNAELNRTVEESSSNVDGRLERGLDEAEIIRQKRVAEQTWRETEKIGRLELEMQQIQYVLLRLMDEKKSKGKTDGSRSNAAVFLRQFFYSRGRKGKKPKKPRFCGCLRPTAAKS